MKEMIIGVFAERENEGLEFLDEMKNLRVWGKQKIKSLWKWKLGK